MNANVCGVADQAGGGTVSAGIFVCFFITLQILTFVIISVENEGRGEGRGVWPAGKERDEGVLARGGASSS